jgi:hypothetical protein
MTEEERGTTKTTKYLQQCGQKKRLDMFNYTRYSITNVRTGFICIHKNSSHQSDKHWKQSLDCLVFAPHTSFIQSWNNSLFFFSTKNCPKTTNAWKKKKKKNNKYCTTTALGNHNYWLFGVKIITMCNCSSFAILQAHFTIWRKCFWISAAATMFWYLTPF